jgi:hypothetical protein
LVRGKRLNILGALLSTGTLLTAKLWCNTTAELFAGFLGLLVEQVGKPLTIILDNASVHTTKAIEPLMEQLKKKGLTLYFLPPYSLSSTASRSSGAKSSTSGWHSRPATPKPWRQTSMTSLPNSVSITS